MPVTGEQVKWLRAYLAGDFDVAKAIHDKLACAGETTGLGALTHMAFVLAARREFSPTWTHAQVIQFVAQVRALLSERPGVLDPADAERELRGALGEKVSDWPSPAVRGRVQLVLLDALTQS